MFCCSWQGRHSIDLIDKLDIHHLASCDLLNALLVIRLESPEVRILMLLSSPRIFPAMNGTDSLDFPWIEHRMWVEAKGD